MSLISTIASAAKGSMFLSGDWGQISKILGGRIQSELFLKKAKTVAMKRSLAFFSGKIKKNIRSQGTLAGEPFKPLSDVTLAMRKKEGFKGTKALVRTGQLFRSVHPHFIDENNGFVGVKRGKVYAGGGDDVADIAEVQEFGSITEERATIPARPFIRPVLDAFGKEAGEVYAKAMQESFNQGGAPRE